jgi:hypothetical protein
MLIHKADKKKRNELQREQWRDGLFWDLSPPFSFPRNWLTKALTVSWIIAFESIGLTTSVDFLSMCMQICQRHDRRIEIVDLGVSVFDNLMSGNLSDHVDELSSVFVDRVFGRFAEVVGKSYASSEAVNVANSCFSISHS